MKEPDGQRAGERVNMGSLRAAAAGRIAAGLLGLVLLALLWSSACATPRMAWNAPRLASAFILREGLTLYPLPDEAAQISWFYGPGFPLFFLPITFFTSPTVALVAAAGWNATLLFGAIALALWTMGLRGWHALAGTVFAGLLLWINSHSAAWLTFIHVDGVAVALCLVAAACAWRYEQTVRERWLHLAAVAAVAAAWTKQTDLVLAAAIALWWAAHRRWALLSRWVLWLALYAVVLTLPIAWFFGPERLLFSVVTFHALNHWRSGGVGELGSNLYSLLVEAWPWALYAACATLVGAWVASVRFVWDRAVVFLGWLCVALAPMGFSAAMKVDGGLNSLHALAFAALALALMVTRTTVVAARAAGRRAGLVALTAVWISTALAALATMTGNWRLTPDWHQDRMLELARSRRGQIYFPWNPLLTVMSERRVLPFEYALGCLELIGRPIPAPTVRAAVGENLTIVYDEFAPTRDALRYFPGHPFVDGFRSSAEPGRLRVFPTAPAPARPGSPE